MKQLFLALALLVAAPAFAHKVIGISDGDTLTLLVDRKPVKIRLANIDAPEKPQAFGEVSRKSLSALCWGRDAQYERVGKHRDRIVAIVTCAGVDVSRAQVERGMAWVYPKYNKDRALPAMQDQAREGRRGLWSDGEPTPPWEFRHARRRSQ